MELAYARIEKGTVTIGNRWIERRWNAFMGTTAELLRPPARRDCLVRRSPEFHLDYDGRPLAAQDLGDIGWSDNSDSHGASVVLSLSGPGVSLQLETVVFHRHPGMIRTLSLINTSGAPATVTRAAVDVLPLDPDEFGPGAARPTTFSEGIFGGETIHYAALQGHRGLMALGACRKARFALFNPNPSYCAPVWEGSALIPPGKTWRAPSTAIYWATGPAENDLRAALSVFHQAWEARRLAEGGLHPSRN